MCLDLKPQVYIATMHRKYNLSFGIRRQFLLVIQLYPRVSDKLHLSTFTLNSTHNVRLFREDVVIHTLRCQPSYRQLYCVKILLSKVLFASSALGESKVGNFYNKVDIHPSINTQ